MKYNPRPSKIIFFRSLNKAIIINSESYRTVLDCASAGAKNRKLFTGKEYYGVNINRDYIM